MKKQAIALLLAAVLVLSGCGRQQLPEETPADMGLAAVAAIESHTPPTLKLTEAQTPPEEPVEEPEEPDWSAGSSDYPWVRSGYAYYIRVNRSANVVTVYTAGDDGRYSVPYRAMVCSSGGSWGSWAMKSSASCRLRMGRISTLVSTGVSTVPLRVRGVSV